MSTVALIPARGGSVRIPRKNMERIGPHSLVARAIICAMFVPRIREIYVSTDDDEIAAEAKAHDVEVIARPAAYSEATSPMEDVVTHFIEAAGIVDSAVIVLLEPSAPLRRPEDIQSALAYLDQRPDAMGVRTLTRVDDPPYFLHSVGAHGFLEPLMPIAYKSSRRPLVFRDNGLVNAFRVGKFLDARQLMTAQVLGMEVTGSRGIDIDTPEDLALARMYAEQFDRV